jgi:hypothetical protein
MKMKSVPLPVAIGVAVAALLLVGVMIWRSTNAAAPMATGPQNLAQEYGRPPGGSPGPR